MAASYSFNPRPREGATRTIDHCDSGQAVSIHAPVKGRPNNARI
mgnify:CR=1 FL=1